MGVHAVDTVPDIPAEAVPGITAEVAADPRITGFEELLGATKALERLLGRAIEGECGISHAMFEVLLRIAGSGSRDRDHGPAEGGKQPGTAGPDHSTPRHDDGGEGGSGGDGNGLTMGEISEDLILTSGGVTRLVDRMVDAGLVHRVQDPSDRRIFRVSMTRTGVDTFVRAARLHARNLDEVFQSLTPTEAANLLDTVTRLGTYARAKLPKLG